MEDLKAVNEIEEYLKAALEQRKNDVIKSAGAVSSAKEFLMVHNQFLEKARNELQKMTNEGKITAEIANFVLAWLGKSHDVAKEYSTSSKSRHDIKSGETLGIDATSRLIKSVKERELKKIEETNLTTIQEENRSNETDEDVKMASIKAQMVETKEKITKKTKDKKKKEQPIPPVQNEESTDNAKEKKLRPDEKGKLSETVKRVKAARAAKKQKD